MSLVVRLCVRPAACRASIARAGIAKAGRAACVAAGRYRQCAGALRTTAMRVQHSSRSISTTTTTTTATTGEAELEEGEGEQPIPGIDKELVRALRELHGVEVPTPLQRAIAREMVCDVEQHLFIRQETGTGKTLMMLAAVLSQAVRDFHKIKTMKINGAPITTNKVFTALAVNTVIVVPNRELALQLEAWSHALLRCAYPRLPAIRFVQRFVAQTVAEEEELGGIGGDTGSGSSNRRELRVLDRHGPPVVVIGTYRRLLQLFRDPSVPLVVRPPRLMRDLFSGSILPERSRPKTADGTEAEVEVKAEEEADAKRLASPFDSSVGDPNRFLQALHSRSKRYASRMAGRGALEGEDLESFVGLRKLVVDEIDSTLSLDSRHSGSSNNSSYKTRRKGHSTPSVPPPRLGQVLVKAIMEMCGSISMLAHVMGVGKEDGDDSRAPSIYQRTLATSLSPSEIRDLGASGTRTRLTTETVQRLSSIFASVSQGAMARLRAADASRLAAPRSPDSNSNSDSDTAGRIRRENEILVSDRRLSTASPASLQVVVAAATPTRSLRHWLQVSGCMHGQVSYLERKQREAHEPHNIPPAIKHHCLIIENGQVVRNLRQKQRIARDSNDRMRKSQAAAAGRQGGRDRRPMENEDADEEEGFGATDPNESRRMLSGMIGEVAGNVIEHFAPTGPVLIFTHPSANKQALIQGLRPFGIVPRDILDHFRARDQQQKQQAEAEAAMEAAEPRTLYRRQRLPPPVYLISEPAARGLDLPDTSLVLVLDTPSSSASYLHMAGRTGRFGRTGHVVSVMPMGVFGFFESKMRAVYSVLGITPERLTLVND